MRYYHPAAQVFTKFTFCFKIIGDLIFDWARVQDLESMVKSEVN